MTPSLPRWLNFWYAEREVDPPAVDRWRRQAGLAFNPFGPKAAELDPRLPDYWVDTFSEQTQGRRAALVFGAPGSGQTAAAMLLAYRCVHPAPAPYEAGAFPVYWNPFDRTAGLAARSLEEGVIHTAAAVLARYLADHPARFATLPQGRKRRLARLLTFWAGEKEQVVPELQLEGPDSGVPEELLRDIVRYCPDAAPAGTVRLLDGAWPQGFDALYLILDASTFPVDNLPRPGADTAAARSPGHLRQETTRLYPTAEDVKTLCMDLGVPYDDLPGLERRSKIRELVVYCEREERLSELERIVQEQGGAASAASLGDWRALLDMATSLAGRGIYLKLFLPAAVRADVSGTHLADQAAQLAWSDEDLAHMLQARLAAAGIEDMTRLCAPDASSDLAARLIQAAAGSPRRLVRLGNRLLEAQARHAPRSPGFSAAVIDRVLGPVRGEGAD
ncbi:MAG: hypothetical protein JW900_06390 [Anaerolineae bacterium]|nr:hypothetical protein [Anaerolineae bacterium]